MTQIPRKPAFPLHMIEKLLAKIQSDVNDDVIPVSTGIYSLQKLKNKLEAIPKPEIENYEDKIFFEVIEDRLSPPDKSGEKCPTCDEEYTIKKNPAIMCNFCSFYCCSNCMPVRKRPHPLSKDANGRRYNICQRCDIKYLNLQLGHSYVENRTLLQQAIAKTTQQLESLSNQCKEYQEVLSKSKQTFEKNKFKIAQLKKQKLDFNKDIKTKLPQQIKISESKTQDLKQKFISVHLKHKQWLELTQSRKRIWEEQRQRQKQKQKAQRQQRERQQQEEQNLRKLKEREKLQQAERIQKERRQAEKRQKQRQDELNSSLRLKKAPSLSQNITLNMNLSYNNGSRLQNEENEKKQIQQKYNVSIEQENNQHEANLRNVSIEDQKPEIIQTQAEKYQEKQQKRKQPLAIQQMIRQSNNFDQYFTEKQEQSQQHQEKYFSHRYETSSKQIFDESNDKSNQLKDQQQQKIDKKDLYISNFTFNENIIDHLKPQESTWHYHQKQRKKSQNIDNFNEPQFSFNQKKQQEKIEEEIKVQDKIQTQNIQREQQIENEDDDNHLSFVDEWYVNKQSAIPQNQSTLSSVINNQQYERSYLPSNKRKTPEQLEEECTKSTSELDEEELQVARYSLIKAARDNAVQERQKHKIYQKSIYEVAPYDEEEETVGEVKKCQCSIY